MNKQKIKFRLKIILGIPVFGIVIAALAYISIFRIFREYWNLKCCECGKQYDDIKKLVTHVKLGCFDVDSKD